MLNQTCDFIWTCLVCIQKGLVHRLGDIGLGASGNRLAVSDQTRIRHQATQWRVSPNRFPRWLVNSNRSLPTRVSQVKQANVSSTSPRKRLRFRPKHDLRWRWLLYMSSIECTVHNHDGYLVAHECHRVVCHVLGPLSGSTPMASDNSPSSSSWS